MPRRSDATADERYERRKRGEAARQSVLSAAGREIGPLPEVADPARRNACLTDLALFCRTYFPRRFYLPFASCHLAAITQMEACTNDGGLFCCAMPRGSGKDTLAECAVLRALLYGLRRFVVLVAATEKHAERSLKKIKAELETNDLLLADFPEACFPVRALERINNRAKGQTLDGEPTRMEWTADSLVLPTVRGAASSGGVIQVAGMTGAIRGLTLAGPDGEALRPDMVVINDPQTREAAKSPTQTADREAIVADDVLLLAGPTTTIAAVMLCTVIYRDDLSDRFLDRERHPEWRAVRTKTLEAFPTRMDLWDQYAEIRRESLRDGDGGARATAFYGENRAAMDAGAVVTWPERMKDGELSGLQSAMNVYHDNPRGFHAELQNDPERAELAEGAKELLPAEVARRTNGVERGLVPRDMTRLTAFVDCGKYLHWYAVVAWNERMGGAVVDYGSWPPQARTNFQAADARPTLATRYPGLTDAQLVYAGLRDLLPAVLGRAYHREGGTGEVRVERCLVDCGYEQKAVFDAVKASPHSGLIYPSKGVGRTTKTTGVTEWKPRPGERSGYGWRLTAGEAGRGKMLQFDPDLWKSFLHGALGTPVGGAEGLTLFGKSAAVHEMLADHCHAEYAVPVTVRGITYDAWQARPDRPDNHLFDTLVGAAVAASVAGVQWSAAPAGTPRVERAPRVRVKLSDKQAARKAERTR